MRYDINHDLTTIDKIIDVFDEGFFKENRAGFETDEPIFILGLPRTGSTLIERVLSQHQSVKSAGELNNFSLEMMAQCKNVQAQPPSSRLALVELTRKLNFEALGKAYIDSTRPDTGKTKHFIDKLPLNSLYVGLIRTALPNAKIIYVQRNPLDTCYAMYKQLFINGYPFSYDLDELAKYTIAHHKLMTHWRTVMPNGFYEVSYESVVDSIEGEARKLIEYCQLDWQEQCLDFQSNKAASTTASATQVRQGIYKSSKQKWRHYEDELMPLKQKLEEAGIKCD